MQTRPGTASEVVVATVLAVARGVTTLTRYPLSLMLVMTAFQPQ
ncbi:MAG TPA: hypothetical protein VMR00_13190 [Streptosporangiaceae bacterium]|nr:hypothetical protein [Streptosporangiaceae bacterium]